MKKIVAVILCALYLVTSSGATVTFHYCMGKFIGADLALPQTHTCSNCGMAKKDQKGCCKDKHQTFQLKKDQLATSIGSVPTITLQYSDNSFYYCSTTFFPHFENVFCKSDSPPYLSTIPIYLSNNVFRI